VNGTFTWSSGTLSGAGNVIVNGTMTVPGTNVNRTLSGGRILTLNGGGTVGNFGITGLNSSQIIIPAGNTLTVTTTGNSTWGGNANGGTLVINGTFTKTGPGNLNLDWWNINCTGVINDSQGDIYVNTNTTVPNVYTGAAINIAASCFFAQNGSSSTFSGCNITGPGNFGTAGNPQTVSIGSSCTFNGGVGLVCDAGTTTISQDVSFSHIDLVNGTLNGTGKVTATGYLNINGPGSKISNTGDIIVGGVLTWSGGTIGGAGNATVAGVMTIPTANLSQTLSGGRILTLNSGGTVSSPSGISGLNSVQIIVPAGQTLTANLSINSIWGGNANGGTLVLQGTFIKTGTGALSLDWWNVNATNGTIADNQGDLSINCSNPNTSTFTNAKLTVASGCLLGMNCGTSTFSNCNISGAGTFGILSGAPIVTFSSNDTLTSQLAIYGGSLTINNSNNITPSSLTASSGTIFSNSYITVTGNVTLSGTIMKGTAGINMTGTGLMTWSAGELRADLTLGSGCTGTITNASSIFNNGRFFINGTATKSSGDFSFFNNAQIIIGSTGTLKVAGDFNFLAPSGIPGGSTMKLENNGFLLKTGGNTSSQTSIEPPFLNQSTGTLGGINRYSITGSFTNSGKLAPGISVGQTGTLTLVGNYPTQSNLQIDMTSTGIDLLNVTGNATLGASHSITVIPGGAPPASGYYTVLQTTGTLTGQFQGANSLPAGYTLDYTNSKTVRVGVPPTVTISGLNNSYCASNAPVTLTGVPAGGAFTIDGNTATQFNPAALSTGSHVVVYSYSQNGLTGTATQTVVVNANPSVSAGANASICSGNTKTFTATGGVSYIWSTGATTAAITSSATGIYTVTATDANGCTGTATVSLTVNTLPTANISGVLEFCAGQSTTLTASGGSQYNWSINATTASINANNGGIYTVTVTDVNSCTNSKTVTLVTDALPALTISGSSDICAGQTATLTASGGLSYAWSTGSTTPAIAVSASGNYTVIATGANGCTKSATASLTVHSMPTPAIAGGSVICSGHSITLTASGGSFYAWSTGQTTSGISVNSNGDYTVTVSDVYSCSATTSISTVVYAVPTASIAGILEFCSSTPGTLTASGGTSYSWNTGNIGASLTVNNSGNYTVTVSDIHGCTDVSSTTVVVHQTPTASISGILSLCTGQSTILTAAGANIYAWNTGETTAAITSDTTRQYTVTVTDDLGCTSSAAAQVIVNALPNAHISGNTILCQGSFGTLTASGGVNFAWSTGASTASISVGTAGPYLVTVTNAAGCTKTATDTVKINLIHPVKATGLVPNGLSNIQDADLYLEWSPDTSARSYNVYIWKATDTKPVLPIIIGLNKNRVFYSIPAPVFNSTYYWQVESVNQACTTLSDTASFTLRNLSDLVVTDIQVPNTLIAGEDITIAYTVLNSGPGYTGYNKTWIDRVYFSDDAVLDPQVDISLRDAGNLSALYPGESYTRTVTFHIPINTAYTGHFHVIVDAGWKITPTGNFYIKFPQTNISNDIGVSADQVTVILPDESDLQIVAGNCPLVFLSNTKIPIDWTVQNKGAGKTNMAHWRDYAVITKDTVTLDSSFNLGYALRDSSLAKDSLYHRSIHSNKIPPYYSGHYYVIITADAGNDVWEGVHENNNRKVIPVDITLAAAPDLVPVTLKLPDTIYYGIPYEASVTVRNQGNAAVEQPFITRIDLNLDPPQPNPQNLAVFFIGVPYLNAGDPLTQTQSTAIHWSRNDLPPLPGNYKPTVRVDPNNAIFEYHGEQNNDSTYQKTVVLATADLVVSKPVTNTPTLKAGFPLEIGYKVKNQGNPFFYKNRADSVFLTTTPYPDSPKVLAAQLEILVNQPFFKGDEFDYPATINLPCYLKPGSYYVWVKTNVIRRDVIEGDYSNNLSQPLMIQVVPGDCTYDLAVTSIIIDKQLKFCTDYPIKYAIKNTGVNPVSYGGSCNAGDNTEVRDAIYLSKSDTLSNTKNTLVDYPHCLNGPVLMPGDSMWVNANINIKSDAILPGDWYI
jgi:hypothetical protein